MTPFHLTQKRPWPFLSSLGALGIIVGLINLFYIKTPILFLIRLGYLFGISGIWWRDVIRERFGHHTRWVLSGLKLGIVCFILREVIFFFSFFWSYFSRSMSPHPFIGSSWPPTGIEALDPFHVPFLNTLILLTSGFTITWRYYELSKIENRNSGIYSLFITAFLGVFFLLLQIIEYKSTFFTITDRVYGSLFFIITGFHGLHVLVGTLIIIVCLVRIIKFHFSKRHHVGFEICIWYWHFVDVVWIFLYIFVYWWPS